MRKLTQILFAICCIGLLGCGSCGSYGGCGYCEGSYSNGCCLTCPDYAHDSVCGQYSCTDNTGIAEFTNDCPGPYTCHPYPY